MNQHERPEKLRATAFDGLAAALSPALIIGMIGSLVFFLVIAFYRGQYDARLMYILALYTAATVLVARIAIESDRARAAAFAVPLAIAAMLGMMRFVTISGELAAFSWIVNIGLLALTWYLADRITFDCTLLEEDRESLQGGLLQTIGSSVAQASGQERKSAAAPAGSSKQPIGAAPLKKAKHNPGVWVLYFALIAFPLFGVGQLVIPDQWQRAIAFWCLVTYLGCALTLLMTTSLLGMRRYLRQRGAMMPPDITAKWLVAGGLITVLILLVCLLMPLPGKQLSVAGMKFELTSPNNVPTSKFGWGNDGPNSGQSDQAQQPEASNAQPNPAPQNQRPNSQPNDKPKPASNPNPSGENQADRSDPSSSETNKSDSSKGDSSKNDSNKGDSNKGDSSKGDSSKSDSSKGDSSKSDSSKNDSSKSDSSKSDSSKNDSSKNDSSKADSTKNDSNKNDSAKDSSNKTDSNRNQASKNERPQNNAPQNDASKNDASKNEAPQAEPPENEPLRAGNSLSQASRSLASELLKTLTSLGSLFKWLLIALCAAIVLFYVVTHIDEVKRLVNDLMNFIQALLGGKKTVTAEQQVVEPAADTGPQRRPFSSFVNPFAKGLKGWQGPQVVQHTFAALEAWAAQRGRVRPVEQTAEEFARTLVKTEPELERLPLQAASMLDRVMFANWQPTREEVSALAELWERMR